MKVIEALKKKGFKIGGFITPEIRVKGKRIGFRVVDVYSGEEGILASVDQKTGQRIGKYRVNLEDFERVALKALDFAIKECDVIAIDEIGKMELFSKAFKEKIDELLAQDKPMICVLHRNLVEKHKEFGKVVWVTPENRDKLSEELVQFFNE
jgi:nucleoside-triphosphatase